MSDTLANKFEKTIPVLPLSTYGLSTVEDFCKVESDIHRKEWLIRAGLSQEEIKLYNDFVKGLLKTDKIEATALKRNIQAIHDKINLFQTQLERSNHNEGNSSKNETLLEKVNIKSISFYPEGHPMTDIKQLDKALFGHSNADAMHITKRRKMLRRLERRKERIKETELHVPLSEEVPVRNRPGSLWDMKEMPSNISKTKARLVSEAPEIAKNNAIIGPKKPIMYTIKDNKILRLEPKGSEQNEYSAVNIVVPVNSAEEQLLEGTKMALDDIKKINKFKDYEPGIPSKVLYLKNIAAPVTQDRLAILFNQFVLDNGGPIDVRLMTGRMRGQAFISFRDENLAIRALEEVNGTILSGKPVIIQFGKNSN